MEERDAPFGLLGRRLTHSWSPKIHTRLGSAPYALFEREPDEVEAFIRTGSWRGINVTIPYKRDAALLADKRSERVERTGAANTLVRLPDQRIFAENTDVLGFETMLRRALSLVGLTPRQALEGRKVVVLGSGGASAAVQAVLAEAGARIVVISRTGEETYATLTERHSDAVLLVNTTPVGMYPACPASPVPTEDLERMRRLICVLDVIYNPLRTGLIMAAEKLGIPHASGLTMLVAQAIRSSELFLSTTHDEALVETIAHELETQMENVVLIGMPGSGKTTTGRRLARLVGRPFVDIDDAIFATTGTRADDIIRSSGEDAFRRVESEVTAHYGAESGLVISCGGGVVTREENYASLHQNGAIVLLNRPIEELASSGRPLSERYGIRQLALERAEHYRSWADLTIRTTGSSTGDATNIMRALGLSPR